MNSPAHKNDPQYHAISWSFPCSNSNITKVESRAGKTALPRRSDVADCNGKEKDYESGVHLPCRGLEHLNDKYNAVKNYGARYYWGELLTGWLSVDPMMDKYPSISSYSYCAWNPVKLVDPDGEDPIYGKTKGEVKKIGDDGKNRGKVYYVTGWKKQMVRMAHSRGRAYTGSLAPSENVFQVPTGNVANDVQTTINMVQNSGDPEGHPEYLIEYGAHSMKGTDNATIWDPGEPMRIDDNGAKVWSINAFMKDGKPTGGEPTDVEFVWHVQPTSSTPSNADKAAVFDCTYNGNMKNATWFVVGVQDGKVSFLSALGKCHTIDMKDFQKMSMQQ